MSDIIGQFEQIYGDQTKQIWEQIPIFLPEQLEKLIGQASANQVEAQIRSVHQTLKE